MAKQTYNINEMLDRKKAIEKELCEKNKINAEELVYEEQRTVDYKNDKNTKIYTPRDKVKLETYTIAVSSLSTELARIKSAIAKHNVEKLEGLLQQREALRTQRDFLNALKVSITKVRKTFDRRTTRENKEGEVLEVIETTRTPMFDIKEVEKMLNNIAEQERKVNTEIQKINLSAKVEL